LTARFVRHDSTEENMRLLWSYLERHGRPVAFYTDKASLFQTAPKVARDVKELPREERAPLPPTQIGRALQELGIVWIAAHSPQAKGRVERSFGTAQDRLVKGLRVAGASTLEEANRFLEEEFLPWWNQHLVVAPANPADAHRPLGAEHDLAASLSHVVMREVDNDYTVALDGKTYRIVLDTVPAGLRRAVVRIERRLDGTLMTRFREHTWPLEECEKPPKARNTVQSQPKPASRRKPLQPSEACRSAMTRFLQKPGLPVWKAAEIDCTLTRDVLD
jgi:hypothetical protein